MQELVRLLGGATPSPGTLWDFLLATIVRLYAPDQTALGMKEKD